MVQPLRGRGSSRLRGVSPVVATALLVLIAVATAALLYLWVMGTVSNQPTSEPTFNDRIIVESVGVDGSNNLVVYVRNVGSNTVNVSAAYVIDSVNNQLKGSNTSVNLQLQPGKVGEVIIDGVGSSLEAGKPYIVKVATLTGVEASYTFVKRS